MDAPPPNQYKFPSGQSFEVTYPSGVFTLAQVHTVVPTLQVQRASRSIPGGIRLVTHLPGSGPLHFVLPPEAVDALIAALRAASEPVVVPPPVDGAPA